MTASPEANTLQYVLCIHYPVQFQGGQATNVRALIDSGSEVNIMNPAFEAKLGLSIRPIGIGAQKIDGSALRTYGMAIVRFPIQGKSGRTRFFEGTFLLADSSMELVLGMPFLALSNVDIQFGTESIIWKSYSTAKALPKNRRVELINQHKFAKVALDENSEMFIVHLAAPEAVNPAIYPSRAFLLAALL